MSTSTLDHAAGYPPAPSDSEPLIGDLLVAQGKITEAERDAALESQRRTGSPLGSILVSDGVLSPRDLFESLALSWEVSFAADVAEPLRDQEFDGLDIDTLVQGGWVPVGRDEEGTLIVVTSNRPTPHLRVEVEHAVGELV